jgi:pentatricopeptide repeat protein
MAAAAADKMVSAVSRHVDAGHLFAALDAIVPSLPASAIPSELYARLLHLATSRGWLAAARRITSHLTSSSPPSNSVASIPTFLLNRTIESLAACGSLANARELFDGMPRRDGGSWNAIISASSRSGQPAKAISLFVKMNSLGVRPKDVTLASVLACCAECLDLCGAQQLYAHIAKRDFYSNVILGTALVDLY